MKIGVDLGGSHISVGLIDDNGKIVCKKEKDFETEERKNIEKTIISTIVNYVEEITDINDIDMIGIASPGTNKNGVIIKAENLDIYNFEIVQELNKYFKNIKIKLSNDAKCAAMCEKKYGAMKKYSDCVFLCLGTGVGGAVFMDNKLLTPKRYDGFELGHVMIKKDGNNCNCGSKGCFETYASMKVLKKEISKKENLSEIQGKELYNILVNNYSDVEDIVDRYIDDLSIGITNYINIFEPEIICLGGSFIYYKDILLNKLIENLTGNNITFNKEIPTIAIADFGNDAGMIGATLLEN